MTVGNERSPNPPVYDGLKVVEIADQPNAEYAGRLLAEMGAQVIKIEPPEGAASRRIGAFDANGESLHFAFYNGDKQSRVLELDTEHGMAELRKLLADADVFVCGLAPARLTELALSLEALSADCPKLVIAAITAFGLTGPWKDYKSSDLVSLALGGPLHMCGYDDHSIPPIRPGGNQGYHTGTAFAHMGILLALLERQRSGKGQIVDLSNHEALAVTVELANPYWFYPRALVMRQTCRHAQPVPTQPALFECYDGYVYFALVIAEERPWQILVEWLQSHDLAAGLDDPVWLDPAYRQAHFSEIQGVVEAFFLMNSANQMYREGQERGLPIGTINAPEELFDDVHLRAREFFVPVDQGLDHPVEYPGAAYRFSAFSPVEPKAAPKLGS